MAQESKSRKLDQYIVRFPDGMRDRLKANAEANNRSMNAEIVARLEDVDQLRADLDQAKQEIAILFSMHEKDLGQIRYLAKSGKELEERLREARTLSQAIPRDLTLYVAIDAKGIPISWTEIMAHLNAITHGGNIDLQQIEARIFDPKLVSSSKREEQWWQLVQHYRAVEARAPETEDDADDEEETP